MENYFVTPEGVQLPKGQIFQAHGHINIKITTADGQYIRDAGIHFDPNNGHPGGQFIGQSFYPVGLADGECIGWVQVHGWNYHYGEHGEQPVCKTSVAPQPEPLFRDTVTVGTPDCDSNSVPLTTINESAGYYLGEDNEWHLGSWIAVGEPVLTTREATAEECPVEQVIPSLPEVPEEPIESKIIEAGHTTQTAQLAETGAGDALGSLVLAAVVLVTGGVALISKAVMR